MNLLIIEFQRLLLTHSLRGIHWYQPFKANFSFHKITSKITQMTTLYINLLLYITFTMIYYIRQE